MKGLGAELEAATLSITSESSSEGAGGTGAEAKASTPLRSRLPAQGSPQTKPLLH
jgi:hypothetical protein